MTMPAPLRPDDLKKAWDTFQQAMRSDPEYAWAWHCNLAVPIMDAAGVSHEKANIAAALIMSQMFEYDITSHPHYEYGKSHAQAYGEMRIAIARAEPQP